MKQYSLAIILLFSTFLFFNVVINWHDNCKANIQWDQCSGLLQEGKRKVEHYEIYKIQRQSKRVLKLSLYFFNFFFYK